MRLLTPYPEPPENSPEFPKTKTPYSVLFAIDHKERIIFVDAPAEFYNYLSEMGLDPEDMTDLLPCDVEPGLYRAKAAFCTSQGDGWETSDDTWFELTDLRTVEATV